MDYSSAQGEETALAPDPGGRPRGSGMCLSAKQAAKIRRIVMDRCPDQLKLPFALWTREAVQQLIKRKLHIDMPIRTVGEYLKGWGFTPQKLLKQVHERCPRAVDCWLRQTYPIRTACEGGTHRDSVG